MVKLSRFILVLSLITTSIAAATPQEDLKKAVTGVLKILGWKKIPQREKIGDY